MVNHNNEQNRLENVARWYRTQGFYSQLVNYCYLSTRKYFKKGSCLEIGCSDGIMTNELVNDFKEVVAVDGSAEFCDITRNQINTNNLEVVCSLFEDFESEKKFDTIIMAHILEHVENPIAIIRKAMSFIKDGGVILIDVPNSDSLHRQAGVKMGLLKNKDDLNDLDKKLGHRRVYNIDSLRYDIELAGLKIKNIEGVFLKPLTNKQIQETWTNDMINAFYELGKNYPDITAEIFAVCEK